MMPVPTTPHREAYEALVKGGLARIIRNCLAGARVGEGLLEVGEVKVAPPPITEHDARLNGRHLRGWLQAELHLARGAGRPEQIEPGLNLPLPWMTDAGTFIRQGVELAPIVQLLPRPGAWLRSSLNESGTRRTAQIDVITSLGSRLRLLQTRDVDRIAGENVTDSVWLVWLTSWQQDPPKDLTSLKGLLASTPDAPWVPTLGAEGRDRLNAFVRRALGTYDAIGARLTVADLDALEVCLERALDEPDPNGPGFGPDPADLREMRALTIADQVTDALTAALAVALNRAQSRAAEVQSSQTPSVDEARTLVAELTAFGQAALSQEPARGGVVMERMSRTRVRAPFTDGRLLQVLDETNPLAQYSHLHKVTRGGPGGVNSRYGAAEYRELHPTQVGALCPFETPESEHLGLRLHLTRAYQIVDGVLQSRDSDPLSSDAWLGSAASLVPFLCHNDAARGLMGAKNLKQAVTLLNPEPPLVATGWETDVAERSGALMRAVADGIVSSVKTDQRTGSVDVRIERPGVRSGVVGEDYVVPCLRPTAAGTIAGLSPVVQVGAAVRAGEVIAAHPAVIGDGLAIGVNLRVAYMPFQGLNSEDGIVVSERLVREQVLASRHLVRIRWTVPSGQQLRRGRAEPNGEVRPARLDNRGIVRVGAWVDTGDEIARTYTRPDSHGPSRPAGAIARRANAGEFGTVVRAHVRRNPTGGTDIEIWLESTRHLEAGDKLMGRHGNKGVVTAVLPDDQMPCIDGVGPVDVVLSPVGMLNRMILGALAETQIGWCLKHPKSKSTLGPDGPFTSATKVDSAQLSSWLGNASHVDGTGRTQVRLGQNGELTDQPVVVGYQYFMKLNHLAQNKVVFRGVGNMNSRNSYGRATLQPVRGRRVRGGQRLGEMESWALAAWGVPALLDEFRGLKSDDAERRSQFVAALTSSDAPLAEIGEKAHASEAWFGLQTLLVALGFNLQLVLKGDSHTGGPETVIGPLLPGTHPPRIDQVARIRCEVLDDSALERVVQERRVLASQLALHLQSVSRAPLPFVETPSVQIRNQSWLHLACGCEGLADEIIDRRTKGGWKCRAHQKPYKRHEVQDSRLDRCGQPGGLYASDVWGGLDTDVRARVAYGLIDLGLRESDLPDNSKTLSGVGQCLHPITGKTMRYVPVVPPIYRLRNLSIERAYGQVVRSTRAYCELKDRRFDGDKLQESVNCLFDALLTLVGTKDGFIRQRLLGKRVDLSGRAVVVAEPRLGIDQCGLPLDAAVGACEIALRKRATEVLEKTRRSESQLAIELKQASASLESGLQVQHWLETRHLSFARVLKSLKCAPGAVLPLLREMTDEDAVQRLGPPLRGSPNHGRVVTEMLEHGRGSGGGYSLEAWLRERGFDAALLDAEDEVSDEFILAQALQTWCQTLLDRNGVKVLLNRQPTLHRYGLMAFEPRVRIDNVIGLSPVVCAAFNADFDGDTMAIHVPATRLACDQAWSRMRPSVNIFSVAAGQPVLQLSHEARAGLLVGKLSGTPEFDDTCAALLEGIHIGDRALTGWSEPDLAMKAIDKGFAWATNAGLSPSWSELTSKDVRALTCELEKDRGADTKLLGRLASPPFVSTALAVLALSHALRRPADALIQLCHRRGAFAKLTGGKTPPVEEALVDGLNPAGLFQSSYGARKTLAEKKMLTPKAGELTRLLAWAAGHYRIAEGDCQTEVRINICDLALDGKVVLSAQQWRGSREDTPGVRSPLGCKYLGVGRVCQACYGTMGSSGRPLARNVPIGMWAATSIGERGTQLALRTFHTGGVAGLDTMAGFPRVRALLMGHQVPVSGKPSDNAWAAIGSTGLATAPAGETTAVRLGDVRDLQQIARVFMFEMFSNYKTDEIDPRHFELVLASMLRFEEKSGRLADCRSLLGTARGQRSPFDALAFGYAKQALQRLTTSDYELDPTIKIRLLGGMQ